MTGTLVSAFPNVRQIDAGVLNVGYVDAGPADGPAVILLHGWPYDIQAFAQVTTLLTAAGHRVVVPYLRGYGTTRFLSEATLRNGEQAALAVDVVALMDALNIENAILAGFDWGARTADIVAALWPERVTGLVSVSGYLIGSVEASQTPLPPRAELAWWYQFYFATERGRLGYAKNGKEFNRLIWQTASPMWAFDDETFERSAASFDNPDHVAIVIHNYRWRIGVADGEPQYEDLEALLADAPAISVSTITMEGDANGAPHPDPAAYRAKFVGPYEHRLITGRVGHNLPQEAPQAFAQAVIDLAKQRRHIMSDDTSTTATASPARPGLLRTLAHRLTGDAEILPVEGHLPPFTGATGWLNSEPLTPEGLRGRVVLVDFWTYTCINWLRTFPYVRAWADKYRDQGLTVIGAHTPEFGFERDMDNVVTQSRSIGVEYPIAIDSDYGVWQAFSNHFWPALYIADAEGRIRYHHFGEGEYAMAEMVVQQLLIDAGAKDVGPDLVTVEPRGLEVAADWQTLRSPETYLGYGQSTGFASDDAAAFDRPHVYAARSPLPPNYWDLSGDWTVARHAAILNEPGGRVAFQFHARDLNLVMGPASKGASIPFQVYLDGQVADGATGTDVETGGRGTVSAQRTYQLIRQSGHIEDRRFEIEFLEAGAEAYCVTFG